MGDMSENFSYWEVECPCRCGLLVADYTLVIRLEWLRHEFGGRRITVTSWCRCPEYNRSVGGVEGSQHIYGKAVDIVVSGIDPAAVHRKMDQQWPNSMGLGLYNKHFNHIDTRSVRARW